MTHRWMITGIVTLAVLVTVVSKVHNDELGQEPQHQSISGASAIPGVL